ncbi:hypothetical protein BD410DRAFT_688823, partial [Rickenella mellea]
TVGLVDQYGHPVSVLDQNTRGITFEACRTECGSLVEDFDIVFFASSFTNWLLPWIALTAQLPYQASNSGSNIMSGLIAVGSPNLITYSLTLTILNRCWIRRRFSRLRKTSEGVAEWAPHVTERVSAVGEFLQDAQQAPIRVSQEDGWLSSLIVLPENQSFWTSVNKDLRNTRRGFSAALFAQLLMALISYLLTVASAASTNGGADTTIALQIAGGSVWIWMIPVILGWILVGTQGRYGAINDALHDNSHRTFRALPIVAEDGNPSWLGFSIIGDEGQEGPIYNYGRIFTWFECATQLESGFSRLVSNLNQNGVNRRRVDGDPWNNDDTNLPQTNRFSGTSTQVENYCGLRHSLNAYTPWSDIPAVAWHHIIFASLVALIVQWGTTGPAILNAYLTPKVGLGCRAGFYLIYGVAATFVWILLVISSLLSHEIMLQHERTFRPDTHDRTELKGQNSRTFLHALAVCTRFMGKSIAVLNAMWLVTISILGYTGTLETCWCAANALSEGNRGWVDIFRVPTSSNYWVEGLVFSILVCF